MNKQIKRLQKLLTDGKITQAEYTEQLQELLDDKIIQQADFDGAKDFEVENEDDKPIYTQEDFDRQIVIKSRKMVKKALTDAGVTMDDVENKDLLTTFASMALQGQKKGNLTLDEAEATKLQKKAQQFDNLQPKMKALTLENAVLKAAGTYNPLNPKQVVRALEDYKELLEYDEDEQLVGKSVDKALKKLAEAEPNLFKAAEEGDDKDDQQQQQTFGGKPPGGAGQGASKDQQKVDAKVAEGLAMLGIKQQK